MRKTAIYPLDKAFEASGQAHQRQGVLIGGSEARAKHIEYLILLGTMAVGSIAAVVWIILYGSTWIEWSIFAVTYMLVNWGASLGYHRYFTHKAFETSRPMQYLLGILAQIAGQGSLLKWAADHRRHHAHADRVGDIHSPHVDGHGRPISGFNGWMMAHFAWFFDNTHTDYSVYGRGLVDDPVVLFCHRTRWFWFIFSLYLLPAAAGYLLGGPEAVIGSMLIGGSLRNFIFANGVLGVNSFAHIFGKERFDMAHRAKNNIWVNIFVLGEGYHNNHHAHPRSAHHGFFWWEIDINWYTIWTLEKLGLVWDVQRAPKYNPDGTLKIPGTMGRKPNLQEGRRPKTQDIVPQETPEAAE